jgi:hypothetical protein
MLQNIILLLHYYIDKYTNELKPLLLLPRHHHCRGHDHLHRFMVSASSNLLSSPFVALSLPLSPCVIAYRLGCGTGNVESGCLCKQVTDINVDAKGTEQVQTYSDKAMTARAGAR